MDSTDASRRFLNGVPDDDDLHVAALAKGCERYVFVYCAAQRVEVIKRISVFAADPDLSLTWYDAAMLAHKVREG